MLGPATADPGGALAPAVPRSTDEPTPSSPGTSSAPVTAATVRLEPETNGPAQAGRTAEEPTLSENGPAAAAETPVTGKVTGKAAERSTHVGAGSVLGAEDPPSGPSRKPLLAVAGLVGVALLAVPLLAWATSHSGSGNDHVSTAANTTNRISDPPATVPHIPVPRKTTAEPTAKKKPAKTSSKPRTTTRAVAPRPPAPPSPTASPTATKKATVPYVGPGPQQPSDDKTASAAVLRLEARQPGRHICYRVYVATFGWQPAVCDGGVAGSQADSRSIKAIQIAVAGTSGTSANTYIQAKGWMGKPWVTVEDGVDLTLGQAKQDAPNISGFGISVGRATGTVCQNTYSRGGPWGSMACDTPETSDNYIFGGTLDVTRWLDAVRFTV
jgi:hypothetical protein